MSRLTKKQLEAKKTRFKIFKYIESHKEGVMLKQVEEEMRETHAKTYHHIKTLEQEGFIEISKKRIPTMNKVVNIVATAIARMPDNYADGEQFEIEPLPKEDIPSHVRVVRLLDNPLPKPQESKKKTKVHVGSGMTLFNNY